MMQLTGQSRPRKEQLAPHAAQAEVERLSAEVRRLRRQLRSAMNTIQCALSLDASKSRVRKTPVQDTVVEFLRQNGETSTVHIAELLRREPRSVAELLSRMRASKRVVSRKVGVNGGGWYFKWSAK